MVLPVRTMSRLRSRSGWCLDIERNRPNLFRAGADTDHDCHCNGDCERNCDAKFGGNCHSDSDADRNGDADRDAGSDGDISNANPDCQGNFDWWDSSCDGNFDARDKRGVSDGSEHGRKRQRRGRRLHAELV